MGEEKQGCLEWASRPRSLALVFLRPQFVLSEALCLVTFDCPLAEAGVCSLPSLCLGTHFSQKIMLGMLLLFDNSRVP